MDSISDLIPLIQSYGNNPHNKLISSIWNKKIKENDESIIFILNDKYKGITIQDSIEKVIDTGDILLMKRISYEYSSYLPVNWYHLYLRMKKEDRYILSHRCNPFIPSFPDMEQREFKREIVTYITGYDLISGRRVSNVMERIHISETNIRWLCISSHDNHHIFEYLRSKYDNIAESIYTRDVIESVARMFPSVKYILNDDPSSISDTLSWSDEDLKIIIQLDCINIFKRIYTRDLVSLHGECIGRYVHGRILSFLLEKCPSIILIYIHDHHNIYNINRELREYTSNTSPLGYRESLLLKLVCEKKGYIDLLS